MYTGHYASKFAFLLQLYKKKLLKKKKILYIAFHIHLQHLNSRQIIDNYPHSEENKILLKSETTPIHENNLPPNTQSTPSLQKGIVILDEVGR